MLESIQSPQNSKLKLVRATAKGKERDLLLLDGLHLVEEALQAGIRFEFLLIDDHRLEEFEFQTILEQCSKSSVTCCACSGQFMNEVSDLESPSGIMAIAKRPSFDPQKTMSELSGDDFVLVCAGIQEPGNMGAVVRVAAGLGAAAVLALHGSCSPWSPRAIRGASGTTFRLPVIENLKAQEFLSLCADANVECWATEAGGSNFQQLADSRTNPIAVVLGAEGTGVPAEIASACAHRVAIGLSRNVESLNVATAAAVFAWQLSKTGCDD